MVLVWIQGHGSRPVTMWAEMTEKINSKLGVGVGVGQRTISFCIYSWGQKLSAGLPQLLGKFE